MRRLVALALVVLAATPAWAKKAKPDKSDTDDEEQTSDDSDDSSDDSGSDDEDKPKKDEDEKPKKADTEAEPQKQDLTGHDLGTKKKTTEFEKDRFFVDKTDTEKTENGTLVQGSLASSSMYYAEGGGNYPVVTAGADTGADRMFTELRLQTDFRHISGGKWDGRFDGRLRFVNTPASERPEANYIQSGFDGQNEYDIRELWIVRNGVRSDVFLGRQYIPDLGGLKIDGVRVDYAKSNELTIIGFGGLYPLRGSRSLSTDYIALKVPGSLDPAGKYVGAAGAGGAYRTVQAYGSLGGVALVPISTKEQARFYVTSSGYYRAGSKLDFYHFALIDLVGSGGFQLTNLSAGINGKPSERLRLTASVNHVDTETLAIQAGAFLNPIDGGTPTVVQNETYIRRLATDEARGGVSAGLGQSQRFQISTAISLRERPSFQVVTAGKMPLDIDDASSVEVWGSIVDRHSIKDARIGIEASQSFGIGKTPYQRNEAFYGRGFVGHQVKDGQGEFTAAVSYLAITDAQKTSTCADVNTCFGAATSTILSLDGEVYYRLNSNWFAMGMLSLSRNNSKLAGAMTSDPTITGLTGFLRIAYRF
jgi:hypothetical protein